MPALVISTESVHDAVPTTVPSIPSSPPHEFEDKSQETTVVNQDGDSAITGGSVSGGLPPTELQSTPKNGSILRPSNIEEVPVVNDPRQWSRGRKVGDKVIRRVVLVLMTAAARYTRHCSLCSPRPDYRRFHLST